MSKDNFTKDDQSQIDIGGNTTQYDSPSNARMYETINKVTNFTGVKPKEILFSTFDKTRKYDTEQLRNTIGELIYKYSDIQYVCIAIVQDKDVVERRFIYSHSDEPFGAIYGDMDYEYEREDAKPYGLYFNVAKNELLQGHAAYSFIETAETDEEYEYLKGKLTTESLTPKIFNLKIDEWGKGFDYRTISLENENYLITNEKLYIPYEDTSIVIYTVDANTLPKSTKSWLKN